MGARGAESAIEGEIENRALRQAKTIELDQVREALHAVIVSRAIKTVTLAEHALIIVGDRFGAGVVTQGAR